MAKKKRAKKAAEATNAPQTAEGVANDQASTESAGKVTKADAVRAALKEGVDKPLEAVEFIKSRFGLEISPQMFSSYKSAEGRQGAKAGGGRKQESGTIDLDALESVKDLVDKLGGDTVKRLVDVLG